MAHGFSPSGGALDDTTFNVGSNNYVIDVALKYHGSGNLRFSLTSDLSPTARARLTLHIWDDSFAFSAATLSHLSTYDWSTSIDDWSSETTRTLYLSVPTVDATIVAQYDSIGGGLEDLVFTLTREGDTTNALDAKATITQDQTWLGNSDLEHVVTFLAGDATATLTIAASKFSLSRSTTGDLTATVSGSGILGGSDTVEIVSTAEPPCTISYDMPAYTFAENATDEAVYVVATLDAAYPGGRRIPSLSTFRRGPIRP